MAYSESEAKGNSSSSVFFMPIKLEEKEQRKPDCQGMKEIGPYTYLDTVLL